MTLSYFSFATTQSIRRGCTYMTTCLSYLRQQAWHDIYHGVFYYAPILAPLAVVAWAPAAASYLACELLVVTLPFLAVIFLLTPSHNLASDCIKQLRTLMSIILLDKEDNWLADHGVENLREYYDQLKKDRGTEAGKINYLDWCKQRNKEPSYKAWQNWHYEQEVFCDPNLVLTDTMVTTTNHYGDPMQAHVFHLKNHNPAHKGQGHKHLVMFVGRQMSAECRLAEMIDFAKKTGMHIHMVNYPGVNDASGRAYTEQDLQKCGRAVVDMLLSPSQHFPAGIPAKNISLYGNCLGSVVAELTFQDLLASGTPVARRILSNGYGRYATGIIDVLLHSLHRALHQLTGPINPTLHNLLTYTLLVLLSPIILAVTAIVFLLPLTDFGWGFSPCKTATGQDHDCLILGRSGDKVLNSHRLLDYLRDNEPLKTMQARCDSLAASVLTQHRHFHGKLRSILKREKTTLASLLEEVSLNKNLNTQSASTGAPTSYPETLVQLLKNKGYDINRAFAEYIVLRATNLLNQDGHLSGKHALLHYTQSLDKQIQEQEVQLTEKTIHNTQRMSHILHDPHFADLYDLAIIDPKTGKVGIHDHGKALYQKLADTTLADTIHAQKTIRRAWQCHLFTKKLANSRVMSAIRTNHPTC